MLIVASGAPTLDSFSQKPVDRAGSRDMYASRAETSENDRIGSLASAMRDLPFTGVVRTKRILHAKCGRKKAAAGLPRRLSQKNREEGISVLSRPGSDLLFQALRLSTIGAGEFNGRVRDGIGFRLPANTTRSAKDGIEASASEASFPDLIRDLEPQAVVLVFDKNAH